MSSLAPYTGDLGFTYAGRAVTLSRKDGAWYAEPGGAMGREHLVRRLIEII